MVKILLTLLICFFALSSQAEIYKWYDENGKLHFGDEKPKNTQTETVKIKPNIEGYKASYDNMPDPDENTVVMYMTDWCGYCKKAKKHFIKNQIPFIEKDIEKNRSAKREHKALGGGGIPVIVLNGEKMRGFSSKRFDKFYADALKD